MMESKPPILEANFTLKKFQVCLVDENEQGMEIYSR